MARYEIIGLYDCPWFAKAEKLVEEVQIQFPIVEFHKSMKDRFQWNDLITNMKQTRGWTIKRSPVIYEVLVEPKGKAVLIGDIDDFCEYVQAFFGILSDCKESVLLQDQVVLNRALFAKGFEGLDRGTKNICNLAILNPPLRMLDCLLSQLLSRFSIAPPSILFNIKLFCETVSARVMEGVCMETVDLASTNLFQISAASSLTEVLYDAHIVLLLEDMSMRAEEETADWLTRIEWSVLHYAEPINSVAGNNCRLLIGGDGPQCYVAEIFRKTLKLKKVRRGHIVAVGQHVVTQAKAAISVKCELSPGSISRVHAWGWPGLAGAYVEVRDAIYKDGDFSIKGPSPCEIPLGQIALHPNWLFHTFAEEFLFSQRERIFKTTALHPTFMCMAEAVVNTLHIWLMSTSSYGPIPGFRKSQICCEVKAGSPAGTATSENTSDGNRPISTASTTTVFAEDLILPVISAGVQCSRKSSFPEGTFMVQPSVCYYGKWIPAGNVSEHTSKEIMNQVNKLWEARIGLVHRDINLSTTFSEFDRLVAEKAEEEEMYGYEEYEEEAGEDMDFIRQQRFNTGNEADIDTD